MNPRHLSETDEFVLPPNLAPRQPVVATVETRVDVVGMSHQGKVRRNNEDVFLVVRCDRSLQCLWTNLAPGQIPERFEEIGYGMVVADGIGGGAGGEVASRLAVTSLVHIVLHTADWIMRIGDEEAQRIQERIAERYRQVDEVLTEEATLDSSLRGMGTTLTLAYCLGADLFLGHIGDSRAYFLRDGGLHLLTRDHTTAQSLADMGLIGPEEVSTHRLRHVLTRCLGGHGGRAEADVHRFRLVDGDQLLLCTDGLTNMVDDGAIAQLLLRSSSSHEACRALIDAALANGGRDNVSVVVARFRFAGER